MTTEGVEQQSEESGHFESIAKKQCQKGKWMGLKDLKTCLQGSTSSSKVHLVKASTTLTWACVDILPSIQNNISYFAQFTRLPPETIISTQCLLSEGPTHNLFLTCVFFTSHSLTIACFHIAFRGKEAVCQLQMLLLRHCLLCVETSFLTGLEFKKGAMLTDKYELGIHLSPPPQCWDYKVTWCGFQGSDLSPHV